MTAACNDVVTEIEEENDPTVTIEVRFRYKRTIWTMSPGVLVHLAERRHQATVLHRESRPAQL
jgi:hypothetical protein